MILKSIKRVIKRMGFEIESTRFDEADITRVRDFFIEYNGFRSLEACAKYTGLSPGYIQDIKALLYSNRQLGLYYFEADKPPQEYMRRFILNKFPKIDKKSMILEVGPGEYPVFTLPEYPNWYGVDKHLEDGTINFRDFGWAKDKYPADRLFKGGWEDISDACPQLIGQFDIVVASHSFEHTFKPIGSLKEANKMLKGMGILVLFVPDGFSDDPNTKDPTHTLYIVPEMMEEFFEYAGRFRDISIEKFRPNADLVITAIKDSN